MEKRFYLPLVDLVKTNVPYENTSMPLITSAKFLWIKRQNIHYIILVNSFSKSAYMVFFQYLHDKYFFEL